MSNLLNFRNVTFVTLFSVFISTSISVQAENFPSSSVLGAANKLASVPVENLNIQSFDVTDVTNDVIPDHITVLNDVLMKIQSDNVLTRLLKRAKLIENHMVVVGVITTSLNQIKYVLVADKRSIR